ncbi:hypothetical protein OF83DRAFT_832260 [Amylostereum chailletii]|nr:hypothetical protein OF83DRAFT_832260 [Amylostereum chailletii]
MQSSFWRSSHESHSNHANPFRNSAASPPSGPEERKADYPIDFVIVGGGIAGLATAYALAVGGHRVHVLEKSTRDPLTGSGVAVPPNLGRIMKHWGLLHVLEAKGAQIIDVSLANLNTGADVGIMHVHKDILADLDVPYYAMHYCDLRDAIQQHAASVGVRVTTGVCVKKVTPPPESESDGSPVPPSKRVRPTVTLSTGEILTADVVIGADGPSGIVRQVVDPQVSTRPATMSVYTGTVTADKLKKYASLAPVHEFVFEHWTWWVGTNRSMLGYPIRDNTEYSMHIWSSEVSDAPESWDRVIPVADLKMDDWDLEPRLRDVLESAAHFTHSRYSDASRPEEWVDSTASIIVVGEAAHPYMPTNKYCCSTAFEDAAVLGTLFSRLDSLDQIPSLLYAYQDLRQGRAEVLNLLGLSNASVAMAAKPHSKVGNTLVRLIMQNGDPDEAPLPDPMTAWDEVEEVWGYSAIDDADEWWVRWGRLRQHALSSPSAGEVFT